MKSPTGYTNPLRQFQRKMAPDFAQREFRDPGLRSSSGLGSLRHTMPHLRRLTATKLQGGGSLDPVGEAYAASRPNLYNPDPMRRRILAIQRQMTQMRNPNFTAMPFSNAELPYAEGGEAPPGPGLEELMGSEGDQSPDDQQMHEIVSEALLALEGRHPDPKEALAQFIDTFGPAALKDLQKLAAQQDKGKEEEEEGEGELDGSETQPSDPAQQDLAAAGGGLLRGPGSGQSDEIEGTTPSGRPVLLSDGEYVIDAPTVAALGDGSSDAGARRLDALRKQIRKDAYGHDKQAKPMRKGGKALVIRLENKRAQPWDYVLERAFRGHLQDLTETVVDSGAHDFAEYRHLCGQIRGIQFAIDQIIELRKRSGQDEDRDLLEGS